MAGVCRWVQRRVVAIVSTTSHGGFPVGVLSTGSQGAANGYGVAVIPGATRSTESLSEGIRRWCDARWPHRAPAMVMQIRRPNVGFSNETLIVSVSWPDGIQELVLRLPPMEGIFPEYSLGAQLAVMEAASRGGVPTPPGCEHVRDDSFIGCEFLTMPFVYGSIPGEMPVFEPWVMALTPEQQATLHTNFIDTLAKLHQPHNVHAIPVGTLRGVGDSIAIELEYWDRYLSWAFTGEPIVVLTAALAWCREQRPQPSAAPSLLWGDVRLGNVVYDDGLNVRAVLDWETATIGPAEMDLAWFTVLDKTMTHFVGKRVPGFLARDEIIDRYQAKLGRAVEGFEWHETFALFRATAIHCCTMTVAARHDGSDPSAVNKNPVLTLLHERLR